MSVGFLVRRRLATTLMQLSGRPMIGGLCLRLAAAMRGPYKDKRILAYLSERSFVSPKAQVHCPRLTLGKQCFIDEGVTIFSHPDGGEVRLGDGVHIYRGTIIEIGRGGSVFIGDHSHVQAHCNIKGFLASTRIGQNVQIAPHCGFSPYEHGFDDPEATIRDQDLVSKGDIVIEDGAWLGLSVQVLDGVTIGHGTVVGAGAVVTKSLPPDSICVGVPARVLRARGRIA
jgi:acetyltransferase-like isoleucine patch superfamily enzyme